MGWVLWDHPLWDLGQGITWDGSWGMNPCRIWDRGEWDHPLWDLGHESPGMCSVGSSSVGFGTGNRLGWILGDDLVWDLGLGSPGMGPGRI